MTLKVHHLRPAPGAKTAKTRVGRGEAGKRQISSIGAGKNKALTHNLGGSPGACVSFVSIVGSEKD